MNLPPFVRVLTRSYAPAWAVLLVGVTLTVYVSARLRRQSAAADQARFARAVRQASSAIRDRLQKYEMAAASLADFVAAREAISQPEWRFRIQLVANEENYPGLLEAGYAELVTARSNTPARNPAGSSFRIVHGWARAPSAMSGVDPQFLAEADQAAAAWQAISNSSPTLSDVRQLSSEINGQPARGISIFAPVHHRPPPAATNSPGSVETETLDDPARRARGVSFCAIQPGLLLEALFGQAPREIGFEIFSRPIVTSSLWLNPSGKTPHALDPTIRPYLQTNCPLPAANQTWSLYCYTTPLFEREASLSRPWVVLPLGLGLTAALTGLMAIQVRARIRQSAVAAELRSACDELQSVQSERERVSRELHDGAIQSLYLLQLTLGRCERLLSANAAQARELLARSKLGLDDLIAELRRFLLRDDAKPAEPVSFQEARAALQHLAERFRSTESLKVQMTGAASAPTAITSAQLQHLRQIAQEAMSNSLRHGQARKLTLDLTAVEGTVRLIIADDGQGLNPQAPAATGNGIANMQARAVHMGGSLKIESHPGRGTAVTLTFPAAATSQTHHEQAAAHQTSDR